MNDKKQIGDALNDLIRTNDLSPYDGVAVAWAAVLKLAILMGGKKEDTRILKLINIIPEDRARELLADSAVDELLNLQPPLESVLSSKYEKLDKEKTDRELSKIRELRQNKPIGALINLANILKRVRNRRAHGFKTPDGPRDKEILSASVQLIRLLGQIAAETLQSK